MWFLILFPIAWLMSEFSKMNRGTRLTLGILAIAATAWLTYDVCKAKFELRERILRLGPQATGNRFHQLGIVEGTKHAKERSQRSLVVFPAESTNWSLQAQEEYRSGYLKGLSTNHDDTEHERTQSP